MVTAFTARRSSQFKDRPVTRSYNESKEEKEEAFRVREKDMICIDGLRGYGESIQGATKRENLDETCGVGP